MEREQDGQLNAYRERLLDALREHPHRQETERPGELQVFVNGECVGTLDCRGAASSLIFTCRERPIHGIEIRTATGLLVGHCYAPEAGRKVARFPVGRDTVEVSVRTEATGGSVRAAYRAAPAWRHRVVAALAGMTPAAMMPEMGWVRAVAVAQVVVALAVLVLLADRVRDHLVDQAVPPSTPSVVTAPAASTDALARSEERLARLVETQEELMTTLRAQQDELGRVQRTVQAVSGAQQRVRAHVTNVEQRVRELKDQTADTLQRHVLTELSRAYSERQKIQEQLVALKAEKDALAGTVSALEARNLELAESLKRREGMLAKVQPGPEPVRPGADKAKEGAAAAGPPQVAEARRDPQAEPFTFWVSFQDGTSEESIERFLQDVRGQKGPITSGWYRVEVTLPGPQPPEGFFESLKQAKIVKAVTAKLETAGAK
jgi:hypothetical protein